MGLQLAKSGSWFSLFAENHKMVRRDTYTTIPPSTKDPAVASREVYLLLTPRCTEGVKSTKGSRSPTPDLVKAAAASSMRKNDSVQVVMSIVMSFFFPQLLAYGQS